MSELFLIVSGLPGAMILKKTFEIPRNFHCGMGPRVGGWRRIERVQVGSVCPQRHRAVCPESTPRYRVGV